MFARHDDDHARDLAAGERGVCDPRRETRLPGSRRGDDQRVVATSLRPGVERIALPRPEREPPGR
jgi:hypothetical protein